MSADMDRDIELGLVEPIANLSHTDINTDTSYAPNRSGTQDNGNDHTSNSQSGNIIIPECPTSGTLYTCHMCNHTCPSVSSDPNNPFFPKVRDDSSNSKNTLDSILSGFTKSIITVTSGLQRTVPITTTEQLVEVDHYTEEGPGCEGEGKGKERACVPQRSVVQFRRRDADKPPEE